MAKTPTKKEVKGDPRGGDAILKRMLKTKPKTHDEMVKARHKTGRPKSQPIKGRPHE